MTDDSDRDDEPRALFALPGLDPHSGGFAVDVTFLLLGGASTIAVTLLASALARARSGEAVDVVGATATSTATNATQQDRAPERSGTETHAGSAEPLSETKPNPLGAPAPESERNEKPTDGDS